MIETTTKLEFLAEAYFSNRCAITLETFKPKGFVIHHLRYITNDVRRKNYPEGKKGTEIYHIALEPLILDDPTRFILVKRSIHNKLDHYINGVARLKRDSKIRFCAYALLTEKEDRK